MKNENQNNCNALHETSYKKHASLIVFKKCTIFQQNNAEDFWFPKYFRRSYFAWFSKVSFSFFDNKSVFYRNSGPRFGSMLTLTLHFIKVEINKFGFETILSVLHCHTRFNDEYIAFVYEFYIERTQNKKWKQKILIKKGN